MRTLVVCAVDEAQRMAEPRREGVIVGIKHVVAHLGVFVLVAAPCWGFPVK
jgi:hypothetical protein